MSGLSVSRLVNVTINLAPTAVANRNFGILMIAGDSTVINGTQRFRSYNSITDIATDFGTSAPEYLAATLFFGQTPKPQTCFIGRWFRTASAGFLDGGLLTPTQQILTNFTAVTNGGFKITIDGVLKTLGSLNFSAATSLTDVCATINGALTGGVISWNGQQFIVTSSTTGTSSTVSYAIAPASGTDISTLLQLTSALASAPVPGFAAETPVQCAAVLANISTAWYGLTFAASTQPTDDQYIAVCAFIEALTVTRVFGMTDQASNTLDANTTSDLASRVKLAAYQQSTVQYSSTNAYAVISMMGRIFAVDPSQQNSTITLMYKQEPGVSPENLSSTQADVLKSKNCNVYVQYDNSTSIIQYGVMGSGAFFDEIWGLDWLQNAIQTACFNALYTSTTKIPQTDAGQNQLANVIQGACSSAVNNGLVAPGIWTGPPIGSVQTNQYLKAGFYIYSAPFASQSQGDREARKAPPIQVLLKLAGAIQSVDVAMEVNR